MPCNHPQAWDLCAYLRWIVGQASPRLSLVDMALLLFWRVFELLALRWSEIVRLHGCQEHRQCILRHVCCIHAMAHLPCEAALGHHTGIQDSQSAATLSSRCIYATAAFVVPGPACAVLPK